MTNRSDEQYNEDMRRDSDYPETRRGRRMMRDEEQRNRDARSGYDSDVDSYDPYDRDNRHRLSPQRDTHEADGRYGSSRYDDDYPTGRSARDERMSEDSRRDDDVYYSSRDSRRHPSTLGQRYDDDDNEYGTRATIVKDDKGEPRFLHYQHSNPWVNEYGRTIGFEPREHYRIAAVVPAYNEEDEIEDCLDSIYNQTMIPDLVVVVPNNCTDNTAGIAEQYARRINAAKGDSQMFVLEMEKAAHRKPEALNYFWQHFGAQCDFFVGMDSDTILQEECIESLYNDIVDNRRIAGVMARYTFDQNKSQGLVSSILLRMQRMEFTSWNLDLMRENYETYVLGGQATIFRTSCMQQIVDHYNRFEGPWSYESDVEDMELTWRLNDRGFKTMISKTARAYCGPMHKWSTLWAQRRKWDEGILRLMKDHDKTKYMKIPIEQDRKMWLNLIIRVLFVLLFAIAFQRGAWVWFWWWALPPVLSIILNFRIHNKMPHRSFGDTIMVLTYIGMETYLLFRLAVWLRSKIGARQKKTDRWAAQARSEGKSGRLTAKTTGGETSKNRERFVADGKRRNILQRNRDEDRRGYDDDRDNRSSRVLETVGAATRSDESSSRNRDRFTIGTADSRRGEDSRYRDDEYDRSDKDSDHWRRNKR